MPKPALNKLITEHRPTYAELESENAALKAAVQTLLNDENRRRLMGDGTFIWHECIFCGCRLDHRHKDDCPVQALESALAALGTGGGAGGIMYQLRDKVWYEKVTPTEMIRYPATIIGVSLKRYRIVVDIGAGLTYECSVKPTAIWKRKDVAQHAAASED